METIFIVFLMVGGFSLFISLTFKENLIEPLASNMPDSIDFNIVTLILLMFIGGVLLAVEYSCQHKMKLISCSDEGLLISTANGIERNFIKFIFKLKKQTYSTIDYSNIISFKYIESTEKIELTFKDEDGSLNHLQLHHELADVISDTVIKKINGVKN